MALEPIQEVKSLVVDIGKAFEEFKATHATAKKEQDSLLETKLKKTADDVAEMYEKAQKRVDALEAKASRPAGDSAVETKERNDALQWKTETASMQGRPFKAGEVGEPDIELFRAYKAAALKYVRYGKELLSHEEHKTMSLGSDPDGGYWAAWPTLSQRIISRVFETTPMRELASVIGISTHEYKVNQDPNAATSGGWVAELGTRSATNTPTISQISIVPAEQYALPTATQVLLEDSAVDIENYLATKAADIISRTENTAFVTGTGSGQPRGIASYTSGTAWGQIQQVGSGSAGAFTYSGLLNLITSLKEPYHANAAWLIKRASIASIMLLTDGSNRYIFQPILGGNFNNTPLLGYTIRYANDIAAVASGALSAAFGDFRAGYQIVDRIGLSLLRDPYTSKPNVLFYFRKRTGGEVIDFDAIKLQVLT